VIVRWAFPPALNLKRTGPGLLPLAVLSGIAGASAGFICGLFRLSLGQADRLRLILVERWHDEPFLGCSLFLIGAAAAGAFGAWLVRRFSEHAAGSGIPHVEAVLNEELPPPPLILVPVKFAGGLAAIGSGFALGREGPCVQMGATLAHFLGTAFGRNSADCRSLLAAGAGAGLAAAFNAPLAGAAFVLEELIRKFETRDAIAALGASGSAIVVARLFTGPAPDFFVTSVPYPETGDNLLCFALGAVAALLGVVYNRVLLGALAPERQGVFSHLSSSGGLFTAVVRAPLTGMILVTEMTADSSQLLPMLAACFSATAVATMLREAPIYDKLKERLLVARRKRPLSISPDTGRRDVSPGTDGSDEPA
jgi:H+/Cl- antiporter ClcA